MNPIQPNQPNQPNQNVNNPPGQNNAPAEEMDVDNADLHAGAPAPVVANPPPAAEPPRERAPLRIEDLIPLMQRGRVHSNIPGLRNLIAEHAPPQLAAPNQNPPPEDRILEMQALLQQGFAARNSRRQNRQNAAGPSQSDA